MLINADIGEMTGRDTEILPHIDIANIACGAHASNPDHMAETVRLARAHHVNISAHPSYADRENFGRISQLLSPEEIISLVASQVRLLQEICEQQHTVLYAIKPHGALYHDMMQNSEVRKALESVAHSYGLPLIVALEARTAEPIVWQIPVLREVFADRGYTADQVLIPRSQAGSLFTQEAEIVQQARRLSHSKADTLCFHGDNPASVTALNTLYAKS